MEESIFSNINLEVFENCFEAIGILGPFIINTSAVPKKSLHTLGGTKFIINLDFAKLGNFASLSFVYKV